MIRPIAAARYGETETGPAMAALTDAAAIDAVCERCGVPQKVDGRVTPAELAAGKADSFVLCSGNRKQPLVHAGSFANPNASYFSY